MKRKQWLLLLLLLLQILSVLRAYSVFRPIHNASLNNILREDWRWSTPGFFSVQFAIRVSVNPCLHVGILVLQQYRAGVNPPKLTLLYTIGTGSARATRWCQGQYGRVERRWEERQNNIFTPRGSITGAYVAQQ